MSDIFSQIDNAVDDLLMSNFQNFGRPLKTLARHLHHPDLETINDTLKQDVDLEIFLQESEASQNSGLGGSTLEWPEDKRKELGLSLLLVDKLAEDQNYALNFAHEYFYTNSRELIVSVREMANQFIKPFIRDYKNCVLERGNTTSNLMIPKSNKIFIVHGHDEGAREAVARFLEKLGFEAIILHEQASQGRTIIEKFVAHGDVGFAVVLLTPDDQGCENGGVLQSRARQNVVLELGYFVGRLGRDRVVALRKGNVEIPSDFAGVIYETLDAAGAWRSALCKELQAAEYKIDWNKVMRP